eukprot:g8117.t1
MRPRRFNRNKLEYFDYFVKQKQFFCIVRDWLEPGCEVDDLALSCLLLDDLALIFEAGERETRHVVQSKASGITEPVHGSSSDEHQGFIAQKSQQPVPQQNFPSNEYVHMAEECGLEAVLQKNAENFSAKKGLNEVDRRLHRILHTWFENRFSPLDVFGGVLSGSCKTHFDFS